MLIYCSIMTCSEGWCVILVGKVTDFAKLYNGNWFQTVKCYFGILWRPINFFIPQQMICNLD